MTNPIARSRLVLTPKPPAHFGAGAIDGLAGIAPGAGGDAAVIVTDQGLAATTVVASVTGVLADGGLPVTVFSEVHPNPTTGDVAAGADVVTALIAAGARPVIIAVGGGSPIDAAKGIAVAAVNPERGRDLDYRRTFAQPALPLVAVPTTAGTGTETNAFGVITDPLARRTFAQPALPLVAVPTTAGTGTETNAFRGAPPGPGGTPSLLGDHPTSGRPAAAAPCRRLRPRPRRDRRPGQTTAADGAIS